MASTVVGIILDPTGVARADTLVQFVPDTTPFILDGNVISSTPEQVITDSNGEFSQLLVVGYYVVHIGDTDTFLILVPAVDGTYDIKDLVVDLIDISSLPSGGGSPGSGQATAVAPTTTVESNLKGDPNAIPLRVAVIGNYGTGNADAEKVARSVLAQQPDIVLTTGNNNYGGSGLTIDQNVGQFYSNFMYPYGGSYGPTTASSNLFFPVPGHEDYANQIGDPTAINPYVSFFSGLPNNKRYYRKALAGAEFFAINSNQNEPDGVTDDGNQAQWLQAALASSTAWPKIVYFADASTCSESGYSSTWMNTWPLASWGANLVLMGRGKVYERLSLNGIPHLVVGTGGTALGTFGTPVTGSQHRLAEFGHVMLEITRYSFKTKFVTYTGAVYDQREYVRPDTTSVYNSILVKKNRGILVGPDGLELDFGHGPSRVATHPLDDINSYGNTIRLDTLPTPIEVIKRPRLKNCLIILGDDPAYIYVYNKQKGEYVLYINPAVTTPYNVSPNPQLAAPTFDPVSGSVAEGFRLNHGTAGVTLWVSINGGEFQAYEDPTLFTTRGIKYVAAYATKALFVDSDVAVAEYSD